MSAVTHTAAGRFIGHQEAIHLKTGLLRSSLGREQREEVWRMLGRGSAFFQDPRDYNDLLEASLSPFPKHSLLMRGEAALDLTRLSTPPATAIPPSGFSPAPSGGSFTGLAIFASLIGLTLYQRWKGESNNTDIPWLERLYAGLLNLPTATIRNIFGWWGSEGSAKVSGADATTGERIFKDPSVGAVFHIGGRPEMQDFGFVRRVRNPVFGGLKALAVVVDGHGRQGTVSGRTAVFHFVAEYLRQQGNGSSSSPEDVLLNAIRFADANAGAKAPDGGTTLVAAVQVGGQLFVANVGDSRAYLITPSGGIVRLTKDDLWPNRGYRMWIAKDGRPFIIAISHSLGSPLIKKASGGEFNGEPEITSIEVRGGETVLLCSDGIHGPLSDDAIRECVLKNPPQKAAESLVERVLRSATGQEPLDNMAAVLLRVQGI